MKKSDYNLFKKNFLMKKVESYFKENPKSNSVLINCNLDNKKTLWKVIKENNTFKVTEINSTKSVFILEAGTQSYIKQYDNPEKTGIGVAPVTPTPPPNSGRQGVDPAYMGNAANNQQRDQSFNAMQKMQTWLPKNGAGQFQQTLHTTKDLSKTLNLMYDDMLKTYQNNEQEILGILNNTYFDGAGVSVKSRQDLLSPTNRAKIAAHLKAVYPDIGKTPFIERVLKENPIQQPVAQSVTPVAAGDQKKNGNSDSYLSPDSEPEKIEKQKSEEEMMIGKNLSGQTIKDAIFELNASGGLLTLDLVNTTIPAKLEWHNNGSVVFTFKDRNYTLRRGNDT
jgi:hypothetical protein